MELFTIPFEDKFIIYRPLKLLAFVGNQALADLACQVAADDGASLADMPEEITAFFKSVGFLEPDPNPPPFSSHAFAPTTAVILLTNRCNLRCVYCYANAGVLPPQDVSIEMAKTAIDYIYESARQQGKGQFEVTFHGGGEPMQAWNVMKEAVAYARSKDLKSTATMVSNGIWSPTQREWVLNNLNQLTISLDGGPDTQNVQRPLASGAGSFDYVQETIDVLDAAKFPYGIRMTATAPWQDRFPVDVQYLCEHTQCPRFQVEPAFNTLRGTHQESTYDEGAEFVDAFIQAFEIAQQAGRKLTYSGARLGTRTRTFCNAPYRSLIINADGHLVTCYEIASDRHTLAEISTIGRLVDGQILVNQLARERLYDFLETKQKTHCADCFCRWHCAGDCYTRSTFADEESPLRISDARCRTNREITARLLLWHIMNNDGVYRGEKKKTVRRRVVRNKPQPVLG